MKKSSNTKLALNRETLAALSPSEMEQANGGTWGQVVRITLRYCTTVTVTVSHPRFGCNQGK